MNTAPLGITSVLAQQRIEDMRRDASARRLLRIRRQKSSVPAPLWVRPQRAPAA